MKVAVVTPYFDEPMDVLGRAVESVRRQTHPATHILVADGRPKPELIGSENHLVLPNHADYGATPRALGAFSAFRRGFDAVAFLDADCWYEPDHVAACVDAMRGQAADFVCSLRFLRRPDGSLVDVDRGDSDGDRHCDSNCMFMNASVLPILHQWFSDGGTAAISDYRFWSEVKRRGLKRTRLHDPTVNYTTLWAPHYTARGLVPPPGAKAIVAEPDGIFRIRPYASIQKSAPREIPRNRFVTDYRDVDVTFFLHCYQDPNWLDHALGHLRRWYPASPVVVASDGDFNPAYVAISAKHGVKFHYEAQRMFLVEHGGRVAHRMLARFLARPTRWLIKLDTDTKVCRRLSGLPAGRGLFGSVQGIGTATRESYSIQGGFVGHDLQTARELHDSGLLNDPSLADYRLTWAMGFANMQRYVESTGRTSMDWTVGYCAERLAIPMFHHPEVWSLWRDPQVDDERYAVIHPCREILELPKEA